MAESQPSNEFFTIKFRAPKSTGEIKNIPISTTFAELQREIKGRTGIAVRHQTILHGFPPKKLSFQVTEKISTQISKNDMIIIQEKKEDTNINTSNEVPITKPKNITKKRKLESFKSPNTEESSKIKTIFDIPVTNDQPLPKKKVKKEETCHTSNLLFVGFIVSSFKDNWFLVETFCPPSSLINHIPWGIGPLQTYFPSYKVTSYSNELKSSYKGEMKKWYVQLKPYKAVDLDGDVGMSQMGLNLHPTSSELVGKSVVFFKKWTKEIINNENDKLHQVSTDMFESMKPVKKRRWEKHFEMPLSHMRELLKSFQYDKDGDVQELRSKIKLLLDKKSFKQKDSA